MILELFIQLFILNLKKFTVLIFQLEKVKLNLEEFTKSLSESDISGTLVLLNE